MIRSRGATGEPTPQTAADWFARMRGPTAAQDRQAFSAWLATDPRHADDYHQLEQRWEQSAFLASSSFGKDRDLTRAAVTPGRATLPRWLPAGIAAALVAAVAIALALQPAGLPPSSRDAAIVAAADTAPRRVELADRSTITLARGAAVSVAFDARVRRVRLLRGHARFAVAPDRTRPFSVAASTGVIVARGTVFDVALEQQAVQVTVLAGKVEVCQSLSEMGAAQSRRLLRAGQQVSFAPGRPLADPTSAPKRERGQAPAMVMFDHTLLADAAARIDREHAPKITVAGDVAGLRVSGAFRADDPLGFAQAIAAMFDLQTIQRDRDVILRRKQKT